MAYSARLLLADVSAPLLQCVQPYDPCCLQGGMQLAPAVLVGCDQRARLYAVARALERCHSAARLAHDQHARGRVPRVEVDLEVRRETA
eukprot:CAMPEP_0119082832 /NCGR_PEP_ID=MMETSP1178-20130426/123146_1 /TAXON_ID=33656 /ORGANISM="unid sp, Strain CCMP2000" /LENGTH=88 /DNA_ID=CAMNT_0007065645 /DNA_START=26 /DNA_END=289 /DNA_ORIENTATION=+